MKVCALLAWYDEEPSWLYRCLASLAGAVHHVVALDGAYATFPGGTARSHLDQYEAIHQACATMDVGLTIHGPTEVWAGGEIEKRDALFRAGELATTERDWYWVIDADEVLVKCPPDFHAVLQGAPTGLDVAQVTLREPGPTGVREFPMPMLFRALRGIHLGSNHYTYLTPEGRVLWGNALRHRVEPRLDAMGVIVDHATQERGRNRREAQRTYYRERDDAGIERDVCYRCRNQDATHTVPTAWKRLGEGAVAAWGEYCDTCTAHVLAEGKAKLKEWGMNTDTHAMYDMPGARPGHALVPEDALC